MDKSKIEFKTIDDLLKYNFFIPSYQRGYRWTTEQIKDLLEDVNAFTPMQVEKTDKKTLINNDWNKIPDLDYRENFIDKEMEKHLIKNIDEGEWSKELERRVQHYGYKYDYRAKKIDLSMKVGELPIWSIPIVEGLLEEDIFEYPPDQLIVNEYLPGQGIAPHVDCVPCFQDTIVSLSLRSDCTMDFTETKSKKNVPVFLKQRSIVVLKGESRYLWTHAITKRKKDILINRDVHYRERRLSLTFRKISLNS